MQGDSIRVTLLVTQAFEQLGISYAVGGSLASSLHGVMRSTLWTNQTKDTQSVIPSAARNPFDDPFKIVTIGISPFSRNDTQ
jgi:hypothetical protein